MKTRGQNNLASYRLLITDYQLLFPSHLEQAIYHTIRYFDILALPLTATQLWRFLLMPDPEAKVRWEGHHHYRLAEVRQALAGEYLQRKLDTQWGYYFLRNRPGIVEQRLARHHLAQDKWKILRRVTRLLAWVPLVEMLAGSGSLALYNPKVTSDLDVFVIVRAGRIWTARLLLLLAAQLTGRRRKHWDHEAPDKVCLNHYVTDRSLVIDPAIRNEYTAVLYTHLVVLEGMARRRDFQEANAGWMKRLAMYTEDGLLASAHAVLPRWWRTTFKRHVGALLLEPLGNIVERAAARMQRRVIERHTRPDDTGRVVISSAELAFHPHSKVESILHQFAQEEGQQTLL